MQEIRIVSLSVDELQSLVRQAVREEVSSVVSTELNRILATPNEDRLVTRSEAMVLLGIKSRTTILSLERLGDLDPIKVGNRASYKLQDIQKFISKKKGA